MLARRDLGTSYGGVQAGHAVAEYLIQNPNSDWKNHYLIYLGVDDREDLLRWIKKLQRRGLDYTVFKEPDIDDQETAVAIFNDGKIFSNLKLF